MAYCPTCGAEQPFTLPGDLDPLISLENAAKLVPCSVAALRKWLNTHWKGPRHYAKVRRGTLRWERRLVSIPELRAARAAHVVVRNPMTLVGAGR